MSNSALFVWGLFLLLPFLGVILYSIITGNFKSSSIPYKKLQELNEKWFNLGTERVYYKEVFNMNRERELREQLEKAQRALDEYVEKPKPRIGEVWKIKGSDRACFILDDKGEYKVLFVTSDVYPFLDIRLIIDPFGDIFKERLRSKRISPNYYYISLVNSLLSFEKTDE